MPTQTTFCRICESLCGLQVELDDDAQRVLRVRPDSSHVATQGFACKKGLRQHEIYGSPDRLLDPMKRTSAGWEAISWRTAYGEIGERLNDIIDQHGADSVAMYVGTAAGFGALHPVFAQGFMTGLGSRSMFASATQDCANKFAVAERMYGFPFTQPFPDLLHTRCLIIVGANPMVSKWSFLQVPNPRLHINAIKARGGRVIVVDPRKTETAKAAGEHVFIRPGSDVYFYAAFLNELIAQGGVREQDLDVHFSGWPEVRDLVAGYTADATTDLTGISTSDLRSLVDAYRTAGGAALYASTGVNMNAHGTLAFWLQEVINAVSGNLDRQGGTLVGRGIIDFPKFGKRNGLLVSNDRSRIGQFRKTNDAYPGGILADEILTPGKGQIRALIVTGGNPLLTMTDGDRLKAAFAKLDLLVTLDIFPTTTASAGHYMLPCTTPLERPDLPFIFPLMLGMQTRPYLQATEAVLKPAGRARDEVTIYTDLAQAMGRSIFGSKLFQRLLLTSRWFSRVFRGGTDGIPQRFWLSVLLRICGQGAFKRYLGHGKLREPHVAGSFVPDRVYTESGKVELAVADLVQRFKLLPKQGDVKEPALPLRLISKREVGTVNSFGHNDARFLNLDFQRNYVYLHPSDAEQLQLADDVLADVYSAHAKIRLPVKLSNDLLPGVVAVQHGWGHQTSGQTLAGASAGVNVNVLMGSGESHVDRLSGMSTLTGIPVRVAPAGVAQVAPTWSGVAEQV